VAKDTPHLAAGRVRNHGGKTAASNLPRRRSSSPRSTTTFVLISQRSSASLSLADGSLARVYTVGHGILGLATPRCPSFGRGVRTPICRSLMDRLTVSHTLHQRVAVTSLLSRWSLQRNQTPSPTPPCEERHRNRKADSTLIGGIHQRATISKVASVAQRNVEPKPALPRLSRFFDCVGQDERVSVSCAHTSSASFSRSVPPDRRAYRLSKPS